MENIEFKQTPERRIKSFLQDYSNNFMAIRNLFNKGGIEKVRNAIKSGYEIPTILEYINQCNEEGRPIIEEGDKENSLLIEKGEKLDKLAKEINSINDSENVDEKRFSEIIEELNNIIYK